MLELDGGYAADVDYNTTKMDYHKLQNLCILLQKLIVHKENNYICYMQPNIVNKHHIMYKKCAASIICDIYCPITTKCRLFPTAVKTANFYRIWSIIPLQLNDNSQNTLAVFIIMS